MLLAVFFVGLSVMLYPAISSYWNSRTQSAAIVDYEKMLANIPIEDYDEFFAKAEEYNKELAQLKHPLIEYKKLPGYNDVLNVNGLGMMGYITIDTIGVELPLYHGTSESVLNIAAGHLEGTSFPVGTEGSHAVVSAHRGLPNATLFTNLNHLEIGDTFEFTILNKTITYQVDQIKVVTPDEVQDLLIDPENEYCTLLTCTPYGINTHRLLVRGVKIDSAAHKKIYITADAHQIDSLIVTPIVALPILFTLMIIVLMKPVKKDDLGDDLE